MVEMVWMEIGGPATLEDASDLENVQTYFDVLQQEEESSDLKTLAKLEKAVEGLYAAADVQGVVLKTDYMVDCCVPRHQW